MSIGNVGTHLTEKLTELNTYLSNDGGHTWSEVLKGPHTFEIGDHGGILIAAKCKHNYIHYILYHFKSVINILNLNIFLSIIQNDNIIEVKVKINKNGIRFMVNVMIC